MFRYGFGLHHGPGLFGWLLLALLAAAVVLGALTVVRLWRYPPPPRADQSGNGAKPNGRMPGPGYDPALSELRIQYARGDLTWEEYAERATRLGYPIVSDPGHHMPGPAEPSSPPPP
jgi:uncharacterized membrane protein